MGSFKKWFLSTHNNTISSPFQIDNDYQFIVSDEAASRCCNSDFIALCRRKNNEDMALAKLNLKLNINLLLIITFLFASVNDGNVSVTVHLVIILLATVKYLKATIISGHKF